MNKKSSSITLCLLLVLLLAACGGSKQASTSVSQPGSSKASNSGANESTQDSNSTVDASVSNASSSFEEEVSNEGSSENPSGEEQGSYAAYNNDDTAGRNLYPISATMKNRIDRYLQAGNKNASSPSSSYTKSGNSSSGSSSGNSASRSSSGNSASGSSSGNSVSNSSASSSSGTSNSSVGNSAQSNLSQSGSNASANASAVSAMAIAYTYLHWMPVNGETRYFAIAAVTNTGRTNLVIKASKSELKDSGGNTVDVQDLNGWNQIIAPGETAYLTSPDSYKIPNGVTISNQCRLNAVISADPTTEPAVYYNVVSPLVETTSDGHIHSKATISNTTSNEAKNIRVLTYLYDKNNNVIEVIEGKIDSLAASQSTTVDATSIRKIDVSDVSYYRIFARKSAG